MKTFLNKKQIISRLKEVNNFSSDTDLANFLGISKSTLSNWYARDSIDFDLVFSKCEHIDLGWLITGKSHIKDVNFDVKATPLVRIEVAAGFGNDDFSITDQDIEANYVVPDFNGIDFMIRVKGSSMYPKYSSGDIIACRKLRDSKFIQWNKCHVIATREQGLLVKRLKKGTTEKSITAISDNKEYEPFEIPLNEVTGIAIVVGVIRLE